MAATCLPHCPKHWLLYRAHGHLHAEAFTIWTRQDHPQITYLLLGIAFSLGETWSSEKQSVVWSSAEAEYRALVHISYELIWTKHLLEELRFDVQLRITTYYNNKATIHITSSPVFHKRTKCIEVDCRIVILSKKEWKVM